MMLPSQERLAEMIGQAMKDRAPALYGRLLTTGRLQMELLERAAVALESALEASAMFDLALLRQIKSMSYLEEVTAREARQRAQWEAVLAEALEFPPLDEATDE